MAGEQSDLHRVELTKNTLVQGEKAPSTSERLLSSAYAWIDDNKVDIAIGAAAIASAGACGLAMKFLGRGAREGGEALVESHTADLLGKPAGYGQAAKFIAHDDAALGGRIGVAKVADSSGNGIMHQKLMVVDGEVVTGGSSFNFSKTGDPAFVINKTPLTSADILAHEAPHSGVPDTLMPGTMFDVGPKHVSQAEFDRVVREMKGKGLPVIEIKIDPKK